jgi:hypothetical protein
VPGGGHVDLATGRGHALIGRALYLPEACAADEEHRELAGVPEEVMFATKPQLAAGPRAVPGDPPCSWPTVKCTAAASYAAASASAGWAMDGGLCQPNI